MPEAPENTRRDWRLPEELWERIVPLLPPRKSHPPGCHRPHVEDRKAMDAVFFGLRTRCQWNALQEAAICASRSAHRRFPAWTEAGVFLALWTSGLVAYDALQGIDWAWLAMDGAMTNVPLGGTQVGKNPTERRKSGTKRSILTEGSGVPIGLAVAGADRNACKMVRETIERMPVKRPAPTLATPQRMCWDKADDSDEGRALRTAFGCTAHIRARGEEAKALMQDGGSRARRWVVERTQSWMHRIRHGLIRWDKIVHTYLGCRHMVWASITWRQAGLFG